MQLRVNVFLASFYQVIVPELKIIVALADALGDRAQESSNYRHSES